MDIDNIVDLNATNGNIDDINENMDSNVVNVDIDSNVVIEETDKESVNTSHSDRLYDYNNDNSTTLKIMCLNCCGMNKPNTLP